MAGSVTVTDSGDLDIDALMSGSKWDSGTLRYSFPISNNAYSYAGEPDQGFASFTPELQAAARQIFATYSQYAKLTFTETTSNSADIRLGMTNLDIDDSPASGRGYFPGDGAARMAICGSTR
jgi:hypothetical protein